MPIAPGMPVMPPMAFTPPLPGVPATKAPPPAACEPIPIGAAPPSGAAPAGPMPIGCANCDIRPSAKSRSSPSRSSRPANRARKPRCRGAAIRSSMWVTTCSAIARPKRAKSAAGIRSVFSIVAVASRSVIGPPEAFDSRSVSVSSPSSCASSSTPTSIVPDDSPAWKESVPLAAV